MEKNVFLLFKLGLCFDAGSLSDCCFSLVSPKQFFFSPVLDVYTADRIVTSSDFDICNYTSKEKRRFLPPDL